MTWIAKLGASALLFGLLAACGTSSSAGRTGAADGKTGGLRTASTSIGTVLVDARGRTVYELAGNTAAHQKCTGECQAIWPPVRNAGSITVINGHPLFTYAGDTAPGQTNGQGLTDSWGHWWALDPAGNPLTLTATGSPTSSAGGGQYGY